MTFHVLTLFPDMIKEVAGTSILGRALLNGSISLDVINIRDFSTKGSKRVDGYPYGGGAGMVMEPEPVFNAVNLAKERAGNNSKVIYLTPAAPVLTQLKVEELSKTEDLILLCGHYEGIDDRVLEEVVDENISIGDYVLTGGELGALVLMDAVSRFVPGVLHNSESSDVESLKDNLLEYPQYTRPEVWHGKAVPEVLLTGDHAKIEAFRHEQSLERTKERRPDLLKKSYRVNVVWFGSEELELLASSMKEKLSLYGEIFNYNRSRIKNQKKSFGSSDFVVFITDEPELADGALVKLSAHGSPALVISPDDSSPDNSFFEEKGFEVIKRCCLEQLRDQKRFDETAFDIKMLLEQA